MKKTTTTSPHALIVDFDSVEEAINFADTAPLLWARQSSRHDVSSVEAARASFSLTEAALTRLLIQCRGWSGAAVQAFVRDRLPAAEQALLEERRKFFGGTENWSAAVRLALYGWAEGREKLFRHAIANPPLSLMASQTWELGMAGAFPDVPEFLSGNPAHMWNEVSCSQFDDVVRISVAAVTNANTSFERLATGGAALLSIVDGLEAAGYRVELAWLGCSQPVDEAGPILAIRIPLKQADQPLDLSRLAFWVAHCGATRRVEFAIEERLDIAPWFEANYGKAVLDEEILKHFVGDGVPAVLGGGFDSIEDGVAYLRKQLDDAKKRQEGTL